MSQEAAEPSASMYDSIGGSDSVRVAVDNFYRAVVADEALAPYFTDVDMGRLKRHQALLLTQLLGGPQEYDGRSLAEAHAGLGINGGDYERVGAHLLGTLRDLNVGDNVLAAIGDALGAVRGDIVTAPDGGAAADGGASDGAGGGAGHAAGSDAAD